MANKLCARQTAKNWRKSPKGFFDKLKGAVLGQPLGKRDTVSQLMRTAATTSRPLFSVYSQVDRHSSLSPY